MNTLYVPLEEVKKILLDMIGLEEGVELDAINSLPTIDLSVINEMIEEIVENKEVFITGNPDIAIGKKMALNELKSRLSPKN